eukprot:1125738-Ditylum_brightwellii.AAC.1
MPATAAAHISASGLTCNFPDSLIKALAPSFQDRFTWHTSYMEELGRLIKLGVFCVISLSEYRRLRENGTPAAILTMC